MLTRRCQLVVALAYFVATIVFTSVSFAESLHPVPKTPSGWKKTTAGRKATIFTKTSLKNDKTLTVKFYQRQVLDTGQSIQQLSLIHI